MCHKNKKAIQKGFEPIADSHGGSKCIAKCKRSSVRKSVCLYANMQIGKGVKVRIIEKRYVIASNLTKRGFFQLKADIPNRGMIAFCV